MHPARSRILIPLFLANLLIPLILGTVREQIVGIWNPMLQMSLGERFMFSFRPATTGAIVVLSLIAFIIVVVLLRPLLRFLEDGKDIEGARVATLKIPWILLMLHVGGWAVGTLILYAVVFAWDSPGGYSFFWSFAVSVSTGLVTGLLTALAVNTTLLDAKRSLGMHDIREGETNHFARAKDALVLLSVILLQTVHMTQLAIFYMDAGAADRHPIPFAAAVVSVTLYGSLLFFGMHSLSKRESRFQTHVFRDRVALLADSGGDLSQRITLVEFDELGQVIHHFNKFLGSLAAIVLDVREVRDQIARTGSALSVNMEFTSSSMKLNSQSIESIRRSILEQRNAVTSSGETTAQASEAVESLRKLVSEQSAGVSESSAAVQQMVSNIASITSSTERVVSILRQLTQAAQVGKEKIGYAADQAREVEAQSLALEDANGLIASIAARTNLLAMNAAIEAAHAGDYGRGFAVVASEIRTLAEHASSHSKTVSQRIRASRETIGTVVTASEDAQNAFDTVQDLIRQTDQLESEVMQAMDEQKTGGNEVLGALASITDGTVRVQEASEILGTATNDVRTGMGEVTERTEGISEEISTIAERSQEMERNVAVVTDLGKETADAIKRLGAAVDQFTTAEK